MPCGKPGPVHVDPVMPHATATKNCDFECSGLAPPKLTLPTTFEPTAGLDAC
jgi:hypothetical protein